LDEDNGVLDVEASCFLDSEFLDDVLQCVEKDLVDAPLVACQSDFCEEVVWRFGDVEGEPIWHNLQGLWKQKRSDSNKMQKMPQQKPALEEERTSKVDALLFIFSYLFDYWRVDSAAFDC